VEASLRGRLKQQHRTGSRVVIGDRVSVHRSGDVWAVESVEERRNELVRRGRGGRIAKVLAANLDGAFLVVAAREPTATPELIDRLLVLAESSGVTPTVVINKLDTDDAAEVWEPLADLYRSVGYTVLPVSAVTEVGLPELHTAMCAGISTLIGPSGVGKSSLLNAVDPDLQLATGALSRKTGTGRHTTVGSRIIELSCGGMIADTPGFGDVGLWSVDPAEIGDCFPDIRSLAGSCRFRGCAHREEPDCAVKDGVASGEIAESRYQSYRTLRTEAEEVWNVR